MAYDPDCEFCAIAHGKQNDTEVIWQGDDWLAFFPLGPATPGHTLVIPREHVADLWAVEHPLNGTLAAASIRVGRAINAALRPDGMNLITSAGVAAEQTVFHLHLHVVPRWSGDAFGPIWPHGDSSAYSDQDLAARARRIREAYRELERPFDVS